MQWVEVAQAEEIEKFRPLILNQVASVAEAAELIALGTANGPTRLGPLVRAVSAASTMARVDAPPEPTIRPVRSLETSSSSRPESAIACSMAMWLKAVPWARNRAARRSTSFPVDARRGVHLAAEAELGVFLGGETPDLASRSEASTSLVLLPMDETMPIPVTTTRRIAVSPHRPTLKAGRLGQTRKADPRISTASAGVAGPSQGVRGLEQADPQVLGLIDGLPVGLEPPSPTPMTSFGA